MWEGATWLSLRGERHSARHVGVLILSDVALSLIVVLIVLISREGHLLLGLEL